jgi:hypothetical protein
MKRAKSLGCKTTKGARTLEVLLSVCWSLYNPDRDNFFSAFQAGVDRLPQAVCMSKIFYKYQYLWYYFVMQSCPEQPSLPRILKYDAIKDRLNDVKPGDTVTEFANFTDLDSYVPSLIKKVLYNSDSSSIFNGYVSGTHLSSRGIRYHESWPSKTKLPSAAMHPKKVHDIPFNGDFLNTSATLLNDVVSQSPKQPREVNVLLNTDLHSTGRGVIGKSLKLVTLTHFPHNRGTRRSSETVKYTSLAGDTADLALSFLIAESASISRHVAMEGLRRVILTPPPGSGKR